MNTAAEHWLWRLSAAAWLAAAGNEIEAARAALGERRVAIAHLRRGAGMALNAVLVAWSGDDPARRETAETMWGRSYVDHLRAVAEGRCGPLDDEAARACAELASLSSRAPELVALGKARNAELLAACDAAERLLGCCAAHCGAAAL